MGPTQGADGAAKDDDNQGLGNGGRGGKQLQAAWQARATNTVAACQTSVNACATRSEALGELDTL